MVIEKAMAHIERASKVALIEALKREFGDPQFENDHTMFFAVEKYYMRIGANLMRTIIVDFSVPMGYDIQLLAGGGGGVMEFTWWAERDDIKEMITKLWEISTANGWQFTWTDPTGRIT